jgi:hypothetical protein
MAKFLDGTSLAVGSVEVTIDAVTYVLEDFNITFPSTRIEQMDKDGVPTAAVVYEDTPTFTATAQFAASTTALMAVGDTFTIASGDGTGTWVINNVAVTLGQRAFKKASISGSKKINV